VVLREAARRLDLAAVVADPLPDRRNPLFVIHSYRAMVTARMMAIAAGYEDADDLDALRHDPALMIACERAPEAGRSIPSQPTISRLENLADTRTLYRIGIGFIDQFCRSYARPPASIALDIDDTDDMVHGQQELALFNTHAGGTCFKPIHIFEAGSGKPVLLLLRPGKRPSGEEIARVLAHVIHRIRRRWPKVAILVRGDGHYCAPEVLDLLRAKRCDYILGLSRNKTLDGLAEPWREQCRWLWKPGIRRMRRFHQFQYAAESWSREEKVIARVEATELGTDARFIVTSLTGVREPVVGRRQRSTHTRPPCERSSIACPETVTSSRYPGRSISTLPTSRCCHRSPLNWARVGRSAQGGRTASSTPTRWPSSTGT
jgi:hypothetical protein